MAKGKPTDMPAEPDVPKKATVSDPTGHKLHPSGRRLSEYEWPENRTGNGKIAPTKSGTGGTQ